MKIKDALEIINAPDPTGFMVAFEWYGDGILRADHFPDKHGGDDLIETEAEALILAQKFANKMRGKACNLYVIDHNFHPVTGCRDRFIENR